MSALRRRTSPSRTALPASLSSPPVPALAVAIASAARTASDGIRRTEVSQDRSLTSLATSSITEVSPTTWFARRSTAAVRGSTRPRGQCDEQQRGHGHDGRRGNAPTVEITDMSASHGSSGMHPSLCQCDGVQNPARARFIQREERTDGDSNCGEEFDREPRPCRGWARPRRRRRGRGMLQPGRPRRWQPRRSASDADAGRLAIRYASHYPS